jgi:hypothetical protein
MELDTEETDIGEGGAETEGEGNADVDAEVVVDEFGIPDMATNALNDMLGDARLGSMAAVK